MKKILTVVFLVIILVGLYFIWEANKLKKIVLEETLVDETINGLIYLINNTAGEGANGLLKWEKELDKRGLTAMIKATNEVFEEFPEVFRRLAEKGNEIIGGYPGSCWDVPYEDQYQKMKETKEYMEDLTGKKMNIFACMYSSYDENTVKAAEALGIPYVLARGTEDVRALLYKPEEYNVKILEVSNVEFADMGRGSLCDASLFARGSTEDDFAQVFQESLGKNPDSMIFVSHPHIGGVKAGYWQVYEDSLNAPEVTWRPFDQWIKKVSVVELPYDQIPENREIDYLEAKPAQPLSELEDLADLGEKIVMLHNNSGSMCIEAKEFFAQLDYPLEEHLNHEKGFFALMESYQVRYPKTEGISEDYGFYPFIIINDRIFSGFNQEIKEEILREIEK